MRGAAAAAGIAKDQVRAASRAFIGVSVALPQAAGHQFVPNGIQTGANRTNAAAALLLSAGECGYTSYVERPNRLRNDVLLYATLWTTLGLLDGVQTLIAGNLNGQHQTAAYAIGTGLLNWWSCGMLTPVYLWLVRHVPLQAPHLAARVALYVAVLSFSAIPKYAIWIPLENAIFHTGWSFVPTVSAEIFGVFIGMLSFVVLLYAMEYYRMARDREIRASRLEAELSNAQLESLRAQIHPHFLFNTLNSILALMRRDVSAAEDMLTRLSDMLRFTLQSDRTQETPLENELATIELYLEIMRVRFGERLAADIDVDEALLTERVPSFVLQPLVENTVRHGLNESSKSTTVRITAAAEGDTLVMRVLDDGRGLPANETFREGLGLTNIRRRLERLYGATATLDLRDGRTGGTEVIIRIPRRVGVAVPAVQ